MYTLISGLYRYISQKDEYSVLILGLDNAGKTTYLEQAKTKFKKDYKGINLNKITTTVGLNTSQELLPPLKHRRFLPVGQIDIQSVRLNFWDLGGQEELQSLWDKYYQESHAVIYIIDASDKERLQESHEAFVKMIQNSLLDGVPLLVLANKQDIEDCMTVAQVKEVFNHSAHLIGHRDCIMKGVSALRGDGVNEGILWVVDRIKRNTLQRPPTQKDIT